MAENPPDIDENLPCFEINSIKVKLLLGFRHCRRKSWTKLSPTDIQRRQKELLIGRCRHLKVTNSNRE